MTMGEGRGFRTSHIYIYIYLYMYPNAIHHRSATQNRGRQAAHCSTSSPWTRGSHGQQEEPVLVKGVLLVSTVQAPSKSKKHASTLSSTASSRHFYREKIPCCEPSFHPGRISVQTKNQGPARARISSGNPQGLEF